MINRELDFNQYALTLAEKGRVQIPNYLDSELAEILYQCLSNDVEWDLAYKVDKPEVIPNHILKSVEHEKLIDIRKRLESKPSDEYSFIYHTYMMVTAYLERRNPELFLNRLFEMLNSPDYLNFSRQLTGTFNINKINAQATKYIIGDYLKPHNDFDSKEGREFAYVINLSKNWRSEYGGLLRFLDDDKESEDEFVPSFNSLSLFKVPKMHEVTQVINTNLPRYAITGWLLSK